MLLLFTYPHTVGPVVVYVVVRIALVCFPPERYSERLDCSSAHTFAYMSVRTRIVWGLGDAFISVACIQLLSFGAIKAAIYFVAACIVRYSSPGYAFAALFTFTRVLRNAQIKTLNRWRVYTYTMGCWLCIHLRFCQLSARIYISNRILISVGRARGTVAVDWNTIYWECREIQIFCSYALWLYN